MDSKTVDLAPESGTPGEEEQTNKLFLPAVSRWRVGAPGACLDGAYVTKSYRDPNLVFVHAFFGHKRGHVTTGTTLRRERFD